MDIQVPQFILDEWLFSKAGIWNNKSNYERVKIICTQPRRLSAIGVANRVAEERIERTGESVGYQVSEKIPTIWDTSTLHIPLVNYVL